MVRISDILKQRGQIPEPDRSGKEKKEEKLASSQEQPLKEESRGYAEKIEEKSAEAEGVQFTKAMAQEEPTAEKEMQLVGAMHQLHINPEESHRIYNHALEVIKEILNKSQSDNPVDLREAYEITKNITDRLILGDKELILLTTNYSEDNYLYAHSVNVCILSIYVGLGLGYNKSNLHELGIGALLHDLGMMKVMGVACEPRLLDEREYEEIKKHPLYGIDILSKLKNIQEGTISIIKQVHERLNGKGYPDGIKGDQMHEYSKIVAVIDVYEALTHPRSYRKALESHEAIKELLTINASGLFEILILKVLINRIGIYPAGSWIELNTSEIGKVVLVNEDSPLRPKVNIIFGPDKERLPQIKSIDLTMRPNLFIKRSINPQELNLNFE